MPKVNYRSQFSYSYAGQVAKLFPQITIGAAGAPTLVSGTGMGVETVTRLSAGRYSILLSGTFFQLLGVDATFIAASGTPAAPSVAVVSQTVQNISAPVIVIQCSDLAGAATDPASGESLLLTLELNRSSTGC